MSISYQRNLETIVICLLLVFSIVYPEPAGAQGSNVERKRQLSTWISGFLSSFRTQKFGKVISLGNPGLFQEAINHKGLQVVFDPGLKDMGKFYPPEALVFGKTGLRNPHIYIKSPEGMGANVTNWHELVHAIIYFKGWRNATCLGSSEPAKGNREEAYTWLIEERIGWLNKLRLYDKDYKKAKREKDQKKRQAIIDRLEKKWKIIEKDWIDSKLGQGPAQYGGHSIKPSCIKKFDRLLGIDIDINKIKSVYPPLDDTGSDTALLKSKWLVRVPWKSSWGLRKYSITVLDDNPRSFRIRVLGFRKGDRPAVFGGEKKGNVFSFRGVKAIRQKDGSYKKYFFPVHVRLSQDGKSVRGWITKNKDPLSGIRQ